MPWSRPSPRSSRAAPRRPRRSSSSGCRTGGCAATRAATAVRSRRGARGSAACASGAATFSKCREATSARCSAIRSRRSLSSTRCRAPTRCPSECSGATCTAPTVRTGSRPSRSATPRRWGRRGTSPPRSSSGSPVESGAPTIVSTYNEPLITSEWAVEVFRAAKATGLQDRVRLQRQRDAASPRLHPPVGRLLQGRPEVDGRQALSPARRRAAERPRNDRRNLTSAGSGSRC